MSNNAGKLDPAPVLRRQRDEARERVEELENQIREMERQRVEVEERRVANRRARMETQEDIRGALSRRLIEAKDLLQEAVTGNNERAPEQLAQIWKNWTRRVNTFLKTKSPGETTEE